MKHFKFSLMLVTVLLFISVTNTSAGVNDKKRAKVVWETLEQQLSKKYDEISIDPNSKLADLIRANQEFSMLRADEANDKRGLPAWLRVWWRKNHPEEIYSADDPTKGYPHVLKEVLEWMITHQNLESGNGLESEENPLPPFLNTIGTNILVSGTQTVPRSESDIRVNIWNTSRIIAGSNNIGGTGRQGMYYSTDSGLTWGQTELPLNGTDAFHSDPTCEWTSDGRAWSSTLGINSAGTQLRLKNYVSTDNGATWTYEATASGTQTNVDKQLVWVDRSSTSPYYGQMYAIWHTGNPAYVNRRTAGAGGTWGTPIAVPGSATTGTEIGSDIRTNQMGDVFGFYPGTTNRVIAFTKSTNGGTTWSNEQAIATAYDGYDIGIPAFNSRRALIYLSGSAYRTATVNNVYATWTDLSGATGCTAAANEPGSNTASTCKTRIWFSRSTNGGTTWSAPVKINDQTSLNDQFNQAMAVDEVTGRIVIIYYDTVANVRTKADVWMQTSTDGGATWSTAEKVSSSPTDETSTGANSGNQYGDYNSLTGYNNCFYPSWTDRRANLSTSKEQIYTASICFAPTAAAASISGKVINAYGRGISKAFVTVTDDTGNPRTAMTNSFGNFHIADLESGKTYILSVYKKGYEFINPNQVITLNEDLTDIIFNSTR